MKRLTMIMAFLAIFFITACGETTTKPSQPHEEAALSIQEKEVVSPIAVDEQAEEAKESTPAKKEQRDDNTPAPESELSVHFIDVGQADATLFQYGGGKDSYNILFDTGDWRGNQVVDYLNAQQVSTIDLVIVSHPDADHIGQLAKVMDAFDVGEVWLSGNESSSQIFQQAIEAVLASDADYYEPRAGDHFAIGPLEIDILYPESISGKSNEESIAALFTYGAVKLLLTGDAGRSEENYMRNHFDVEADILHLGHHGSKTSSDPAFIDAVSPSIAVYSAGAGNSYGHPSPEVVATIEERDIELYGTDSHGTITITTDGQQIGQVETASTKSESASKQATSETSSAASEEVSKDESDSSGGGEASHCININEASIEEVQEIIHIGPARAEDVIAQRPYENVDDLTRINGIGPARIADIKTEGKACVL